MVHPPTRGQQESLQLHQYICLGFLFAQSPVEHELHHCLTSPWLASKLVPFVEPSKPSQL